MRVLPQFIAKILLISIVCGWITPIIQAAPISSTDKYAWSSQVGWLNFNPTNGAVDVSDTTLTGAAWSDNHGWIYLQPTTSGVDNLVETDLSLGCIGNLSGQAWNPQLGWLDFENVYIDSNGDFQGTATGMLFGNVSFQGTNYGVNTDWRPDCVAPSAPGAPDLLDSSDTGVGSGTTDNITSQILPSFELVCTEAPSTLTLYSGTGVIATESCTATGSINVTATVLLTEGSHSITYTETDPSNLVSPFSPSLNILIDTTLPNISITAPTKLDNTSITDTTFTLTDTNGVDISSVTLGTGSLSTSGLSCTPANGVSSSVTCSVSIDTSGNFSITVSDVAGNSATTYENNYIVDILAPSTPTVTVDTSAGVNSPTLTFASTDNIAIAYYDIEYLADDAGPGFGNLTTLTSATSPQSLSLDPDTLTHIIAIRAYDTTGNMSETILTLPLLVSFTVPTLISNSTITDATVTVSNPNNNPLTNIALSAGTTNASLGICTGSGSDISDPYESPVTCTLSGIANSGTLRVSAEDSITGAQGQNTQSFVIETIIPTISITAPTKIDNAAIPDTTLTILDDTGILAAAVSLSSSSVSYSNLVCTQTNPTQVDCTVQIDGSGDIQVSVSDRAGNTNTGSETGYIVDLISPSVSIDTAVIANTLNQNLYPVSGTCSIGDGNVTVSVLGATPATQSIVCSASGTWSATTNVSTLPDAQDIITLSASQMDGAGNIGSALPTLVDKDTSAPIIQNLNASPLRMILGQTLNLQAVTCTDNTTCTLTQSGSVDTNIVGTYTLIYIAIDTAGNTSTQTQIIEVQPTHFAGGGTGGGRTRDLCASGDTSGDLYDGICEKEIIILPLPETSKPIIPEEEDVAEEIIPEEEEVIIEETETLPESSEEEGYMERFINGKRVGYTLENTYDGCPIIDALNDETYKYSENFFPDTKISKYPKLLDLFGSLKITNGNTNGLFEPKREITRAEFTKMVLISHCHEYQDENTTARPYRDLEENTWEARVVSTAQKLGIISGYDDGTFRPEQVITKAEATKILMRMAMVQSNTLEDLKYNDVNVQWHKKYIQVGETLGVFNALQDNSTFKPDQGVTREDMVHMIHKIVDLYR